MKLTKSHFDAMRKVENGADVYDYGIAVRLREVKQLAPTYLSIVDAMNPPNDVRAKQPYFGAILTHVGKRAIAKVKSK